MFRMQRGYGHCLQGFNLSVIFVDWSSLTVHRSSISNDVRATMSLLQDVLRSHTADALPLEKRLSNVRLSPSQRPTSDEDKDDSDDDLVNVVCSTESSIRVQLIYNNRLGFITRNPRPHQAVLACSRCFFTAFARPTPHIEWETRSTQSASD